jgi:hypothetical protein
MSGAKIESADGWRGRQTKSSDESSTACTKFSDSFGLSFAENPRLSRLRLRTIVTGNSVDAQAPHVFGGRRSPPAPDHPELVIHNMRQLVANGFRTGRVLRGARGCDWRIPTGDHPPEAGRREHRFL